MTAASDRWRDELAAWKIPEHILAAAPESPWGFPVEMWRAGDELTEDTPSRRRGLEALPPGGEVLDVGCGGGRAGLALAVATDPRPSVTGVDDSPAMLEAFDQAAADLDVPHRPVLGGWPEIGASLGAADVVVCHHVFYNVPELVPFAHELTRHARRRVVVELTDRHPLVPLGPMWKRFHDLDRPDGPTAELAQEVLAEAGIEAASERHELVPRPFHREHLVAFTRRRLCLPASRDPEVDEAIGPDLPMRVVVTLWWEPPDR